MRTYIGIDNGSTGTWAILKSDSTLLHFDKAPTKKQFNYQKKAKNITRIDVVKATALLDQLSGPIAVLERPMVNPKMFNASTSALRAFEATLIALELLHIPHIFIDSKQWQKEMLPSGIKGSPALKAASRDVGLRLFPQIELKSGIDCDGLLIAEWARRNNL